MASYRQGKYISPSQRMYRGFDNESSLHTIIEDESLSLFTDSYAPSEGTFCGSPRSEWKQMDMSDDDSLQSPSTISSSDTDSTVSTNFTESNIPGAGRMLGKLYSSAGKRLEKVMARLVSRAGYGPEATYSKLLDLYRDEKRDITDAEGKDLLKHCQKLLDYASSNINSTKLLAIEKLLGIFKIHKLVAFVISADSGELHTRFMDLSMSIERTAYRTAPVYTQRVYDTALLELSKVEIHKAGVTILSSKDRAADVLLRDSLKRLVSGLRTYDTAPLSLWYLQWLPGLSIDILFDPLLALDLCDSLATALMDDDIFELVDRENLTEFSLYTHEYLLHHLEFLTPFRHGRSYREYLAVAGAAALDEFVDYRDATIRIQQVIDAMNDLAMAFNRRTFQHYPEMETLRDYHSIELIYERICSALDELDNTVTVAQVSSLETIIMKLCIELLEYTSSDELGDKLPAIEKLGLILREKDVFAWFLSAGPPDIEGSILALIESIESMRSFDSMSEFSEMLRIAQTRVSLVRVHKAGVGLLEARGEKLRLASHAVKPDWDSNDSSLTCTDWKTSWTSAFKALLAYLDSDSPKAASLALEYLCCSCWSFPYSSKPSHGHKNSLLEQSLSELDPQLALDLCGALRGILTRDNVFWAVHKNFLFWVSARMVKHLLSRMDFVKRFCDREIVEENVDFEGAKLHVPTVISQLVELIDAHEARAIDTYSHYANPHLYAHSLEMKEATALKKDNKPDAVATVDAAA